MTPERIARVKVAGWLSFPSLCLHCGYGETKMNGLIDLPDFPRPSMPTGNAKERRRNKAKVDAWLEAHEAMADGDEEEAA